MTHKIPTDKEVQGIKLSMAVTRCSLERYIKKEHNADIRIQTVKIREWKKIALKKKYKTDPSMMVGLNSINMITDGPGSLIYYPYKDVIFECYPNKVEIKGLPGGGGQGEWAQKICNEFQDDINAKIQESDDIKGVKEWYEKEIR